MSIETGTGTLSEAREQWEEQTLKPFTAKRPERREHFETLGGVELKRLYTPEDVADIDYQSDIGYPGQYPYTRGPYPTMYRAQPWTMRQIAGFGTASDTNGRFKFLIAQGQTGISTDFDMPTLMGYDSDDVRSEGEVGREGVAIDSVDDMLDLYSGIDLEKISVSMTINPSAWILFAMYLVAAEEMGFDSKKLSGTIQNDIIKEFTAQKEWVYPPRPSMRIVRDTIVYSAQNLPHYNPVNISGYHIREAGSTAIQEVAFTLAAGIAYVEEVMKLGLDVDSFAPRLAFYFVSQIDFLEEVAKFRAARRIWARVMKERFEAKKPESMRLRFHCQTAGASCTAREPLNNIARTAIEALAAVCGGAQSLHTNGYDEALSIPSEAAMKIALRTQQIVLEEAGVANTIDPLAGSYAIERLTSDIEKAVFVYFAEIERRGGVVAAIEDNYFQSEIGDAAYDLQMRKERGEFHFVGVTKHRDDSPNPKIELHHADEEASARQLARLAETKARRDPARVKTALEEVARVAKDPDANLMPATIEAARARATMGEIINTLVPIFGRYTETPVI